jgi:acetylornithine deacetylase
VIRCLELYDSLFKWVDSNRESVVKLTEDLVRFDTTIPDPGGKPRQDRECQNYIADVLRKMKFSVDQWEPDSDSLKDLPSFMPRQSFKDRPLTVGVLKGKGGGKSLLFDAHIDVVPADPVENWRHKPWGGEVEGDRLYGRGANDMKAGAAVMIKAMESVQETGIQLKGDVILEFVLDEELNGMGTAACMRRGYRADAGIVPEPSYGKIRLATRGLLYGTMTVRGRSAHAETKQPHRLEGGGVNAIEKAMLLIKSMKDLEADWRDRPDKRHKYLANPEIVTTMIRGGQFTCTYPEYCEVVFDAQYLKANADKMGWGSLVIKEIEDQVHHACECDPWLKDNPPTFKWTQAFPPSDIDENAPIVETLKASAQDAVGKTPVFAGNNSADDSAYLMTIGGIPSVSFGPGPSGLGHTIDEYVSIESMIDVTKILALCIIRWCGT